MRSVLKRIAIPVLSFVLLSSSTVLDPCASDGFKGWDLFEKVNVKIQCDNSVYKSAPSSMLIKRVENKDNFFEGFASIKLPSEKVIGKELTVKGWSKVNTSGPKASVVYHLHYYEDEYDLDNWTIVGYVDNKEWEAFEFTKKIPAGIHEVWLNFFIGGHEDADVKAWFDDIEIYANGEKIIL